MDKIFVSYSRADSALVDGVIRTLEDQGHQVWIDREDLALGDSWQARISSAIQDCKAFLLILSPRSAASSHVITELSLADHHRRPIIPVLYNRPVIPPGMEIHLAGLQYIDLSRVPYQEALAHIHRALQRASPPPSHAPKEKIGDRLRERLPTRSRRAGRISAGSWSRRKRIIVTVILVSVALVVLLCVCSSLLGAAY